MTTSKNFYTCTWCKGTGEKKPKRHFLFDMGLFVDSIVFFIAGILGLISLPILYMLSAKTEIDISPSELSVIALVSVLLLWFSQRELDMFKETEDPTCPRCKGKGQLPKTEQ